MDGQEDNYTHLIIAGLVVTVLLFAALAFYSLREGTRLVSAAESRTEERIRRGGEIYAQQCAACHGEDGGGVSGPALNNRTVLKNTLDSVFFSVVRSGVPGTQMPAWSVDYGGPLTDEDVRDVVTFIRAWEPTAPEIQEETFQPDAARGAVLFSTTCAICHGEIGGGGERAPRINDPSRLAGLSDDWYRQVIRNGRPARGMPTWGTVLSPNQIEDLIALVDAWRSGITVTPDFSVTELLGNASFALEQEDPQSASLHLERALNIVEGPGGEALRDAAGQIEAGDLDGARETLAELQEGWPLGNPAGGVPVYSANCAACHGVQGEGGIGLNLQNSDFIGSQSNAQLVEFLLEGRPGTAMTGYRDRLDESQLADVVALLRLWQNVP